MATGSYMTPIYSRSQSEVLGDLHRWSDKDFVPDEIEAELLLEENRLVKKDLEDVSTFAFSDEVKRKMKQKSKFKSKNVDVNSNSSGKSSNQVKISNVVIATNKNKSVHGLPELSGLTENCIPCKLAKSRRVSFKPIDEWRVAERYNLTALDGIKTLLNESGIRLKFWAEALICFSYTWNRVYHKGYKKTPFELYGGKRPSVSHLKKFGYLAFIGVPKQLRRKLDMRAKLGIMLGYALSTKGYRIWLIEENKVVETINVRFDEGKRGVDSEKTFTGPVKNYLLKDFPEDGDIFSAVGDRADHPEAGSERDTRPGGADSESQTGGTHTLRPCASIPWIRKPVERKDRSRTDIYYFVEGSNVRLRSFNEVQKHCKDKNIDYDQNLFNFSGKNSSSGKVTDLLNVPLEEKANLAEVRIPKTYREATRTAEAAHWEGAMDKEMQVMYDRKVWNLVEPPKEAKVLGCSSQSEVPRDLHNGAQRINPENRVGSSFRIIPEQYFSGIENIDDFLENIDHNLAYYEIPAQLACAYLKGHLKGRALDWFVLGYRVIEDKTTDYAHLKQALS
ncbi:retrovirus-related Pol polyprotein from transposon TNT 1-94 [Trichonephila clavipes]|nr:retrovirus-related Pol polyprotein from transposon TNT 1-94 [Trichonephila clavipes]